MVKTKTHKDLGNNCNVCRSYREKNGREDFLRPQIVNRVNKAFSNIDIPKNTAPHHFNCAKVTPCNFSILSEYQY